MRRPIEPTSPHTERSSILDVRHVIWAAGNLCNVLGSGMIENMVGKPDIARLYLAFVALLDCSQDWT